MAAIERLMRQLCAHRDGAPLGRLVWEHLAAGGKRLRALLALRAVDVLGGDAGAGLAWGAACELLHNASLIHDDLQDGDRYRRGREALWVRHGPAQAINAGDLCIALAYLAIGEASVPDALRWQLSHAVAKASRTVVRGQAGELELLRNGVPSWARYAACVEGKTAALFSLPIEGAALLAGRPAADAGALAAAVRPLGLLFQLQDDLLDLWGENGRELRGSDLAQQGKASALVIEHLRLHPDETGWLLEVLARPREQTPRLDIERAIDRFARGGALAAVWERIDAIRDALHVAPPLTAEPALGELVDRFAARALLPVAHTRPPSGRL